MIVFSVFKKNLAAERNQTAVRKHTVFPILYVLRHLIFCEFSMKTHPSREWLRGCLTKSTPPQK